MNKVVLLLRAGGPSETLRPTKKPTLEEMQGWVDGFIAPVSIRYKGRAATMVVNEDGLVRGLPVNPQASELAGFTIVGDAFVLLGWRL